MLRLKPLTNLKSRSVLIRNIKVINADKKQVNIKISDDNRAVKTLNADPAAAQRSAQRNADAVNFAAGFVDYILNSIIL